MATQPLMAQARANAAPAPDDSGGSTFTPKDPREFIPPEQHDAVEKVFAAGVKTMFAPEHEQERQQAIASTDPVPKVIADNVTGLLLTLDKQSKGGIPEATIFPAGVMLANEAGNMLVHAGKPVDQSAYNESLQLLYVQLGKKLGASDDQLMQGAQDALAKKNGGMDPADQTQGTQAIPPDPTGAAPPAGPGAPMAAAPGGMPPPAGVATLPPQQGGA